MNKFKIHQLIAICSAVVIVLVSTVGNKIYQKKLCPNGQPHGTWSVFDRNASRLTVSWTQPFDLMVAQHKAEPAPTSSHFTPMGLVHRVAVEFIGMIQTQAADLEPNKEYQFGNWKVKVVPRPK